jgi:hypothetical protein
MGRLGGGMPTRGAVIYRSPSVPLHHRTEEAIAHEDTSCPEIKWGRVTQKYECD